MAREAETAVSERATCDDDQDPPVPADASVGVPSAIALLRSWQQGDVEEQRETWEFLERALDEHRPSYRKLFTSTGL